MSRHHQQKHPNGHEPHPAVAGAANESTGETNETFDASDTQPSKGKSSKANAAGSKSASARVVDISSAKARWREVAANASAKLSELFDEGKAKVAQGASEVSKRVAGAADEGIDEAFEAMRAHAKELMESGKSTRVRIKLRERQLTEIPIAALAAAEAASLWWFGPVRMLLGHLVGRAMLDFEFVSSADPHVAKGRDHLAAGDLDDALAAFDQAIAADHTSAVAHFQRGVLLKIRGDGPGAKQEFARAEECDSRGEYGVKARAQSLKLA